MMPDSNELLRHAELLTAILFNPVCLQNFKVVPTRMTRIVLTRYGMPCRCAYLLSACSIFCYIPYIESWLDGFFLQIPFRCNWPCHAAIFIPTPGPASTY